LPVKGTENSISRPQKLKGGGNRNTKQEAHRIWKTSFAYMGSASLAKQRGLDLTR